LKKLKEILKIKAVRLVLLVIIVGFVISTFSGLIGTLFYYFVTGAFIIIAGIVSYSFFETVIEKRKEG